MNDNQRVIRRVVRTGTEPVSGFSFDLSDVRAGTPSGYVNQYRQEAFSQYQSKSMPQLNEEAWRRTDLKMLNARAAQLTRMQRAIGLSELPAAVLEPLAGDESHNQLVLAGSTVHRVVDPQLEQQGLVLVDIRTAEEVYPELLERIMGKLVASSRDKLAAMAAAFNHNGILLYVPPQMRIATPIHTLVWGIDPGTALFTHLLVYLDEGAEVTLAHECASPAGQKDLAFHSGVVEVIVAADAKFRFAELQSWGENVFNITHEKLRVDANGEADWVFGSSGSRLTKNFTDIELAGEGATGKVSGFYFASGQQHLDHDTQQLHLAPHTTSDLLFKGALVEKSRSVWRGMIYVAPEAQQTDGYQTNRNLMLSENARADSIPGLEILADDVRCSHGATVGRIDETQIFYLLSRGIPRDEAERLIVEGYFDPIMERIPFKGVKARFHQIIEQKMTRIGER